LVKAAIAAASAPIASAHGITEVAQRLEVSRIALVDHLHNLGLLDEVERSELRFGDAQE
jgi:hypothetical protein